jgi:hypothetical protein
MTAPVAPPAGEAFSDILLRLGRGQRDRLGMREVLDAFGEQGLGALMLIFALFSCLPLPPGGSTITGAPLLLLSLELATVRNSIWLPRRFVEASVTRATLRRGFGWMIPLLRFAERITRPRLLMLTGRFGQGMMGLACFLLAIVLVLPIPLGNMVPAATIALFALGLMQRDGFVVVLGWIGVAVSVGLLALVWRVVLHTVTGLYDQLTNLHLAIP